MKNNKGFIAISLIYSFFLIFLMSLLAIIADYVHNRILLNDVKTETKNYLNNLTEFNPLKLENRTYPLGEIVDFGSDAWIVIENTDAEVTLVLQRMLTSDEITAALSNSNVSNASNGNLLLMCLNAYNPRICNYLNTTTYNYYSWEKSIAKIVVDYWLTNNASLQKAIALGILQSKNFSDGINTYNSFIRIPNATEYNQINDSNIWYITSIAQTNGISYIEVGGSNIPSHETYKGIKPVIVVKKSS